MQQRAKWTGAEIERLVKEQKRSGKSVPQFCAAHGIEANTFYNWRQRFKENTGGFARVESSERISLQLESGVTIRVDREDLKAVLEALK